MREFERTLRGLAAGFVLYLGLATAAQAQINPTQVLMIAATSAQTGNLSVFGAQLQQVILMQTNGTGRYAPLVQLGPVTNAVVFASQPLPYGMVIQGRVFHQNGISDWTIGVLYSTNRIENAQFNFMPGSFPAPNPGPSPSGPAPSAPGPTPTTSPPPSSTSDGCQKYPTLCQ